MHAMQSTLQSMGFDFRKMFNRLPDTPDSVTQNNPIDLLQFKLMQTLNTQKLDDFRSLLDTAEKKGIVKPVLRFLSPYNDRNVFMSLTLRQDDEQYWKHPFCIGALRLLFNVMLKQGDDFFMEQLQQTVSFNTPKNPDLQLCSIIFTMRLGTPDIMKFVLNSIRETNNRTFIKTMFGRHFGFNHLALNDHLTSEVLSFYLDTIHGASFLEEYLLTTEKSYTNDNLSALRMVFDYFPTTEIIETFFSDVQRFCGSTFLSELMKKSSSLVIHSPNSRFNGLLSLPRLQLMFRMMNVYGDKDYVERQLTKVITEDSGSPALLQMLSAPNLTSDTLQWLLDLILETGGQKFLKSQLACTNKMYGQNALMVLFEFCSIKKLKPVQLFLESLMTVGSDFFYQQLFEHRDHTKRSAICWLFGDTVPLSLVKKIVSMAEETFGKDFMKQQLKVTSLSGCTPLIDLCSSRNADFEHVNFLLDLIEKTGGTSFLKEQFEMKTNVDNTLASMTALSMVIVKLKLTPELMKLLLNTIERVGGRTFLKLQLANVGRVQLNRDFGGGSRMVDADMLMLICLNTHFKDPSTNESDIPRDCLELLCTTLFDVGLFSKQYKNLDHDRRQSLKRQNIDASFVSPKFSKQQSLKDKGNAQFARKNYKAAMRFYSEAISVDPHNEQCGALYSNCAACHQELGRFDQALSDAEDCIRVRDDWSKGYWRKGTALRSLGRVNDAVAAFEAALKLDPDNQEIKDDIAAAIRAGAELFAEIDQKMQALCETQNKLRSEVAAAEQHEIVDLVTEFVNVDIDNLLHQEACRRYVLMLQHSSSFDAIRNSIKEFIRRRTGQDLPRVEKSSLNLDLNDESLELGSGSTCHVHACSYYGTDTAAKIFLRHVTSNKNLQHEMSAAIHVKHPNILNLLGIIVSDIDKDKIVGLLMQRMSGTLLERVKLIESFKQSHPPSRLQLLTWCAQTAAAIACAHSLKCIHCDIKPENVMLDQHQNAKLSDFGSAHVMSTVATEMTGVRGTALYTAPELTKGASNNKPSEKTDVFSFGMLMWVVFHSSRDHGMGPGVNDINNALGRGERPTFFDAGLPADIVSLIRSCWHEDPSERPNMAEAVAVLHRVIASHTQNNVNDDQDKTSDALFKRSQLEGKLRDLRDEKKNHIDQILDRKIKKKWLAGMNFSMDIPTARLDELQRAIDELEDENLELTQIIGQQAAAVDDSNEKDDDDDNEDDENQSAHLKNADTRPARGHQAQSEVSVATSSTATAKRTTVSAFTGAPSATSSEMRQVQNDDDLF